MYNGRKINMETATFKAFEKISDLDRTFIGTEDYLGIAFFWGSNPTKHYLRDSTTYQRKRIHKLWLKENLDLHGESPAHYKIISDVMKVNI
tara:strand:+ start:1225 stop:1497 length:273 start_codon:yes stop_codon:yes gene_type:complete